MPNSNSNPNIMPLQQVFALALQHHHAGRFSEAEAIYKRILSVEPNHPDALNCLGMLAHQRDQNQIAAEYIQLAIGSRPSEASYYNNLGLVLMSLRQVQAAVDAYQNAIRLKPDYAQAYNNLGNAFHNLQDYPQAMAAFGAAIRLNPQFAEPHYNLGCTFKAQGLLDEAISAFRAALQNRPDLAEAYNNLGAALKDQGKIAQAVAAYQAALRIRPCMVELYVNLGNAFKDLYQYPQAINAYHRALELKPDLIEAHNNLGNIFKDQGCIDECIAAYRTALKFDPRANQVHSNLIYALHHHPDYDAPMIHQELRNWNKLHAEPLKQLIQPCTNRPDPKRRLKIGYISPDFCAHVVGWNLLPLLQQHDRQAVEIFAYSGVVSSDEWTRRIRSCCDVWRSIVGIGDQRTAQMIREDQIDILIDLSVHTAHNRLLVFAYKPAPVQATYLGYPGSTGMDTVDYRFSDAFLDPPETDLVVYSEQTIRLPQTYWCYQPGGTAPEIAPLPASSKGFITFGCINNFAKVSPAAWDLWTRILRKLPNARMMIHANPGVHLEDVRQHIEQQGISPDRVDFVGTQSWEQYMRIYNQIDIALDPIPYNGGITTCDSLLMGVPVVTLRGQTAVGRAGYSMLTNIGLPELIAQTPDEYVQIALKLASDLPRLAELRRTLRPMMKKSPLMDAKRFAQNVEAAYRGMWHKWCSSKEKR
ncbi:MAG TPA: tetratricopeptide repeat protein [Phycisphaerae bacterium]|nr:tetratricopeptide repeat protein [Phycisphaerae bacterium]